MFSSCQEFIDYMKALIANKKLSIKTTVENQMTIELMVEYLFKQDIIKFDLLQKKANFELIAKDLYNKISALTNNYKILSEENKSIKNENQNLKERINNLENIINSLKNDIIQLKENNNKSQKILPYNSMNSTIIKTKDEFDLIYLALKERMNKEIKELKKLYQATTDGGDPEIFHRKCDFIQNTLILYETAGNRRFGAFVSEPLRNQKQNKIFDKNCFLFSLDKKKIYFHKNNDYYCIHYYSKEGPNISLNGILCIVTGGNVLKKSSLRTNEERFQELFERDLNALSEDGKFNGVLAKEYEVFIS